MNHRTTDVASAGNCHRGAEGAAAVASEPAGAVIDLQRFCGADRYRAYLMRPFSRDGFTWATNGHILVRVATLPQYADSDKQFDQSRVLQGLDRVTLWARLDGLLPPEIAPDTCEDCGGSGDDPEETKYSCMCCDGTGKVGGEKIMSITVDRAPFALHYARLMHSLPHVEIGIGSADNNAYRGSPLLFRFAGGVGALMPLRSNAAAHVEFTPSKDRQIT